MDFRPSSVWCLGSDQNERRCRFTDLCYKKDSNDFVFLSDISSIKSGLPSDRFSPALVGLSSVRDHNQFYFNFVEIPFNVLNNNLTKSYKIEFLKGKTFIMSRFKADNLMHYFHDDLIPLYFTLQELGPKQIDLIFLNDIYSEPFHIPFDQNVFERVFPKSLTRNQMNENTIYCMEESFVGLSKATTFYDSGFRSPQSAINKSEEESALISKTIRKLTKDLNIDLKCDSNDIIFISRQNNRKIINEEILIQSIAKSSKLSVIKIENLYKNFEQIIKKVFCAQILIGIHGSALILSQFLRPGSSLIELFPFAINPDLVTPYKTLTQLKQMDIHYFYWRNILPNNTITHEEYPKHLGGVQHLSVEEREVIVSKSEDVSQHLCCDDPYWLYRIYSDTIVDINSFEEVLTKAMEKSSLPIDYHKELIAPGLVIGLSCEAIQSNDNQLITIVWQKPWNLHFIDFTQMEIKYEVLVQEMPSNSAKSSLVTANQLSFLSKANKRYNIWIRCKVNDIFGPFNTNPLICLDNELN